MPELPEVAALGDFLRNQTLGHRITHCHQAAIGALKTYDPPLGDVVGREVADVVRAGKWLALELAAANSDAEIYLVFHLAKAGWLRWRNAMPEYSSKSRPMGSKAGPLALRVWLEDGTGFDLTEAGTRKRLAVYVVSDLDQVPMIASLGFDPVAAMADGSLHDSLNAALDAKKQQVKGALRDQTLVAGIGNAYSDEILHAAKVSPFALTTALSAQQRDRLAAATDTILSTAMEAASGKPAAELKDAKRRGMAVHGRTGQPCPVCGDVVREVSFADRSLQYCATCQTGGKPLADRRMSKLLK